MAHETDSDTNCNWCARFSHQRTSTRNGGLGNERTSGDHPKYCIVEFGENTKKSPGDLLSLRFQWKTISYHWCEKTLKGVNDGNNNNNNEGWVAF